MELQKSQKLHNKIIQKQLKMSVIKKYLKKDIYLQKGLYHSIIMEYQKIIHFSDITPNQPPEFKTKNWVQINDESFINVPHDYNSALFNEANP